MSFLSNQFILFILLILDSDQEGENVLSKPYEPSNTTQLGDPREPIESNEPGKLNEPRQPC